MSQGRPAMWTGITARVRGVRARSTSSPRRLHVTGSTSARTGRAPRYVTASAVAVKV